MRMSFSVTSVRSRASNSATRARQSDELIPARHWGRRGARRPCRTATPAALIQADSVGDPEIGSDPGDSRPLTHPVQLASVAAKLLRVILPRHDWIISLSPRPKAGIERAHYSGSGPDRATSSQEVPLGFRHRSFDAVGRLMTVKCRRLESVDSHAELLPVPSVAPGTVSVPSLRVPIDDCIGQTHRNNHTGRYERLRMVRTQDE